MSVNGFQVSPGINGDKMGFPLKVGTFARQFPTGGIIPVHRPSVQEVPGRLNVLL